MSTHNYLDKTGLGQVWSKIKDYADPFVVTITYNEQSTYVADKTFTEIVNAYNSGKICIAIQVNNTTGYLYTLVQVQSAKIIFARFGARAAANGQIQVRYAEISSSDIVTINNDLLPTEYRVTPKYKIASINGSVGAYESFAVNNYGEGDLFWVSNTILAKATTNIAIGATLTENTNYVTTTIANELKLKLESNSVLTKTNTTSYTPNADYHPATKKYVDDATAGITSDLSGLTDTTISSPADGQLLKYNTTTSKWENATLSLAINNGVIQLKEGNTVISSVTLPIYNGGVSS